MHLKDWDKIAEPTVPEHMGETETESVYCGHRSNNNTFNSALRNEFQMYMRSMLPKFQYPTSPHSAKDKDPKANVIHRPIVNLQHWTPSTIPLVVYLEVQFRLFKVCTPNIQSGCSFDDNV
jgi:hypothetical protein